MAIKTAAHTKSSSGSKRPIFVGKEEKLQRVTSFLGFLQLLFQLMETRNFIPHAGQTGVEGLKVEFKVQGRSDWQASCACSTHHQSIGLQRTNVHPASTSPPCSLSQPPTNFPSCYQFSIVSLHATNFSSCYQFPLVPNLAANFPLFPILLSISHLATNFL